MKLILWMRWLLSRTATINPINHFIPLFENGRNDWLMDEWAGCGKRVELGWMSLFCGGLRAAQPHGNQPTKETSSPMEPNQLFSLPAHEETRWADEERENKLKRLMLALIFLICGLWASGPSAPRHFVSSILLIDSTAAVLP